MTEKKLNFDDNDLARLLYGDLNKNLATIEKAVGVSVKVRGNQLALKGLKHEVEVASLALQQFYELIKSGYPIYPADVAYGLRILKASKWFLNIFLFLFIKRLFLQLWHLLLLPSKVNFGNITMNFFSIKAAYQIRSIWR